MIRLIEQAPWSLVSHVFKFSEAGTTSVYQLRGKLGSLQANARGAERIRNVGTENLRPKESNLR